MITPVDVGVALSIDFRHLDAIADRVVPGPYGSPASIGDCTDVERLGTVHVEDGAVSGAAVRSATVWIERPSGRRDSVALGVECLFASVYDGEVVFEVWAAPVRPPLAGGWRLTHGVGDGDGYGGDWVVGRSWDAHRSGAPAPFIESDAAPTTERIRTELALLVEGVRGQRQALDACAEASGTEACTAPEVLRPHGAWLRGLEAWTERAAVFQP